MEFFDPTNPIIKIIIAALLGMFLGIRRESISVQDDFLGIRTMAVLGALGCISTLFPEMPYLPVVLLIGILVFIIIAYAYGAFKLKRTGLTSEFSAIIVFFIGILVGQGSFVIAIVLTAIIAIIIFFKEEMHRFARAITREEWIGALQLFIISGVILPFLPREPIDPWGVFNPFTVWLLVIFISGIGFIGYFLIKYTGEKKALPVTSILGSFVSSTAVTTTMSEESKRYDNQNIFAVSILLANTVMLIRNSIIIFIIGGFVVFKSMILGPLLAISILLIFSFIYFINNDKNKKEEIKLNLKSPFRLKPALIFALIFSALLFIVHFAIKYFGDSGVYVTAFISGIVDTEPIILSVLEQFKNDFISLKVIRNVIIIVLAMNTFVKIFYVKIFGSRKLLKKVVPAIILATLSFGLILFL